VIVGSQLMLGPVPNPEEVFTVSMEADIYPLQAPELADKIDCAIGEGSQFHETFGYYAQGVSPETAILPKEWMQRVHRVQNGNTNERVGYCLDVLDLFLAKAAAGREKDREFCMRCLSTAMLFRRKCLKRCRPCPLTTRNSERCAQRFAAGRRLYETPDTTFQRSERSKHIMPW